MASRRGALKQTSHLKSVVDDDPNDDTLTHNAEVPGEVRRAASD